MNAEMNTHTDRDNQQRGPNVDYECDVVQCQYYAMHRGSLLSRRWNSKTYHCVLLKIECTY